MSIYKKHRQFIKKSIVETAVQLFETKGYEQTSVAAITQEVGIAKGTFYNHFDNKSDILFVWAENVLGHLDTAAVVQADRTIFENLEDFCHLVAASISLHEKLYLIFLRELQTIEASAERDRIFDFKPFYMHLIRSSSDYNTSVEKNLELKVDVLNNSLFAGIVNFFREYNTCDGLEYHMIQLVTICLFGILSAEI